MDGNSELAVYTAMFGDYDVVIEPQCIEESIDYVCFTDVPEKVPDPWETRELNESNLSPKLKSGIVKTLPHKYLPNYEQSMWVDSNIVIKNCLKKFILNVLGNVDIAVPQHRLRECIYTEAKVCIERDLVDEKETYEMVESYRKEGLPENNGLSETRILLRNHQNEKVIQMMELWWKKYRTGPERDQLSFDYARWKTNISYLHLPAYISVRSKYFEYYPHKVDVTGGKIYEQLLRWRWAQNTIFHPIVCAVLLKLYLLMNTFLKKLLVIK